MVWPNAQKSHLESDPFNQIKTLFDLEQANVTFCVAVKD